VAVVALVVYAAALAAGGVVVWRRPGLAVYAYIVGLAAHNGVLAGLFALGLEGDALTAIAAWKEVLLAVALAGVARDALARGSLPFRPGAVDLLALVFAAFVALYAVFPQGVLDGEADGQTVLYAFRHHLVPVAAFVLGRSVLTPPLGRVVLATAAAVAVAGVVESDPCLWRADRADHHRAR
jgi:hypothetical protein